MTPKLYQAVIQKIIANGKHGPFAVTTCEGIEGSITFSLNADVWKEPKWPEAGEYVLLAGIHRKRAGWRATEVRFFKPGDNDQQTETRKEHGVNSIKALLRRWKAKFFPTEDDKTWKSWVTFEKREERDLVALLTDSKVQEGFKARALYIMLMPSMDLCPFYWIDHDDYISRYHGYLGLVPDNLKFKGLSPTLLVYSAELIAEFYQHVKEYRRKWLDGDSLVGTMEAYNNYIIELLPLLPKTDAEKLFRLFEINDAVSWSNMDDSSGYNPLERLFCQRISESWKRQADTRMRQVILNELAGKTQPRAEYENALWRYADMIQLQFYGKPFYSRRLFVDQVDFIVRSTPQDWSRNPLFHTWHVGRILKMIGAEGKKDLLRRFALFVLSDHEDFKVYDDNSLEAAKIMLDILKGEKKATTTLRDAIQAYNHSQTEREKEGEIREGERQAILERMKQPVH